MDDERGHRVIVLPRADFFRVLSMFEGYPFTKSKRIREWALENDLTDLYFDGVQLTIDDELEEEG